MHRPRALVTGGGGFIGAWIVEALLARGIDVRIFEIGGDRRTLRAVLGPRADALDWVTGDVSAPGALEAAARGCGLVVHLAAVLTPACSADPVRGAEINLMGTLRAFHAAAANGIRTVLHMSSAGVFGPDSEREPRPTTFYGAFKLGAEHIASAWWHERGIASLGFRPLVVYGPGREIGLTADPTLACRAAARGEPHVIRFGGTSDFVHVRDVAAAFAEAACTELTGAEVLTIAGELAPVEAFAAQIRKVVPGAAITVEGPALPVNPDLDRDSLGRRFPALRTTGIAEGVAATIDWYRRAASAGRGQG